MFVDGNEELIAAKLGITVEELGELRYREDSEESNDGLVYSYYMEFEDENPWRIMVKVMGLDGNVVRFQPGLFETEDTQ